VTYARLDVLGSTPWKINRKVFDVVLEVWKSGEWFKKLPPAVYEERELQTPENNETDLRLTAFT
jgi:DNA-directed RNA polymerase